jgi:hypothetical protein
MPTFRDDLKVKPTKPVAGMAYNPPAFPANHINRPASLGLLPSNPALFVPQTGRYPFIFIVSVKSKELYEGFMHGIWPLYDVQSLSPHLHRTNLGGAKYSVIIDAEDYATSDVRLAVETIEVESGRVMTVSNHYAYERVGFYGPHSASPKADARYLEIFEAQIPKGLDRDVASLLVERETKSHFLEKAMRGQGGIYTSLEKDGIVLICSSEMHSVPMRIGTCYEWSDVVTMVDSHIHAYLFFSNMIRHLANQGRNPSIADRMLHRGLLKAEAISVSAVSWAGFRYQQHIEASKSHKPAEMGHLLKIYGPALNHFQESVSAALEDYGLKSRAPFDWNPNAVKEVIPAEETYHRPD